MKVVEPFQSSFPINSKYKLNINFPNKSVSTGFSLSPFTPPAGGPVKRYAGTPARTLSILAVDVSQLPEGRSCLLRSGSATRMNVLILVAGRETCRLPKYPAWSQNLAHR